MEHNEQDKDTARTHENIADEQGEAVSLSATAIAHWKSVLLDPDASDTAKSNAASGLAQIDRQQREAQRGTIHRLTRSELTQEIARMRALIASMP